jgi:hypothetical protein
VGEFISPYLMRRIHGWGPKGKVCGDCISCILDDIDHDEESVCAHEKAPKYPFIISPEFPACRLFKSQWQHERELLEAQGQMLFTTETQRTQRSD